MSVCVTGLELRPDFLIHMGQRRRPESLVEPAIAGLVTCAQSLPVLARAIRIQGLERGQRHVKAWPCSGAP